MVPRSGPDVQMLSRAAFKTEAETRGKSPQVKSRCVWHARPSRGQARKEQNRTGQDTAAWHGSPGQGRLRRLRGLLAFAAGAALLLANDGVLTGWHSLAWPRSSVRNRDRRTQSRKVAQE